MRLIKHRRQPRPEPFDLLFHEGDIAARREGRDNELIRMGADDIQRTDPD
jgi:hypothetical protein